MASASNRRGRQAARLSPARAQLADRLIGSAQALETAATALRRRATQLRQYGTDPEYACDDLGWGTSDLHHGYQKALSQLTGEGGS
jgi:hypothetical protein